MEYQKTINLLDDTANQWSKLRTRDLVEINDGERGAFSNNNIKFKTSNIRSNLWDYSDAYKHVKGTIKGPNTAATAAPVKNTNKKVIFKLCAPFISCITEINNAQLDDAQHIDIVIPMYDLIEYRDVYLKLSESLWQHNRDEYSRQ